MSSGAVDTKTVEMRFDNSDFESNAKQTMSTLEKLKAALKLDGASAGLKEIEKTSEKLDFKSLNNNIDGVGKHFSKLETIATGVLLKIGMSAAETGMKIAKSLTIDQVAAGWNKYAEKTTAVQTIMANLREDEGKFINEAEKMEYVNGYLEKLMWFSDETSYRFVDMTSNVGKFIANGQNLKDSVTAMQGIATWAALSGQEAQAASRAMYNISQAFGVGSMKIMDWKSIENANMATAQFKKLAITVAQEKGKIKEGQVTVENFRDSLSGKDTGGWFDNEVMMEVFRQYGEAADKIQAYSEETGRIATDIIRDIRNGNKQIQDEVGITADSLAFKAFEAAQQAKTFKEVVNATADAVSTKWMRIFENVFGNYLQAKELWTDLSEDLWNIFAGPLDVMGDIMETWNSGFINPQDALQQLFASGKLDKLGNGLKYVSKAAAELAVKNDSATYSIETLEDGTQRLVKLVETAPGVYSRFTKKIYDADKELLSGRDLLIGGFRNILRTFIFDWKETNKAGKVIEHKSILTTIKDGLKEVIFGTSDMEKIVPMVSKKLWDMTKRFNELTEKMMPSEETLGKIKNTFKGLFTIFKIGGKFFSPILKQFQKLFGIGSGLKTGKRTILDLADSMGTWIQELDKWLEKNKIFDKVSKKIGGWLGKLKTGIDNVSIALTGLTVKNFAKKIANKVFGFFGDFDFQGMFNSISGFFTGIVTQIRQVITDDLPDELTPLQKFLVHAKKIFGGIKTFFKSIGPTFKTIGGKVGKAFMFVVNGIVKTVKDIKDVATGNLPEELSPIQKFLLGFGKVFAFFKNSYEKIITTFPKLIEKIKSFKLSDLNTLFSPIKNFWLSAKTFVGDAVKAAFGKETTDGMSKAARRLAPIVRALKSIFDGLGDLFDSAGPYIEKAGKWIGEFLSNIGKNLDKFVGNKSGLEVIESLVTLFKDFSLGKLFLSVAKLDKRFEKILKLFQKKVPKTLDEISKSVKEVLGNSKSGISGFFNRILDYITKRKTVGTALVEDLESIRDIFKAYKREINAEALIDFAIAIGILAGSMWLLSKIPSEKLVSVGNAIGQIAVVVAGLYVVGKLISGLGTFISGKYGTKQNPIVAAIKDILTSTVKSSIFANDATAKFFKFAAGVALIALAIKWISGSMEDISKGIITLGKAYANPKFKDGLKVLGMLAGGLAITSFISSIGGAGIFTSIATFALFLIFVKRAKKLVGQITELGESTNGTSFYKGLEYMAWLLAGIGAISLSAIAVSYSNLLGILGTLGIILVMTRFVRIVSKSLSELASSTDSKKIDAAADAINRLTYPLLAFALLTSVISRNKKARSAMGRAILAILAGTLMIRLIAKSLMNLADEKVDAERIKASASIITSIMTSILITFGVLTLLSGLTGRFKAYASYNGKAGAFFAALGFVGICFGIKMMAEALQGIASIGDETKISKAADIMTGLIIAVGIAQGLLTLASGSNIVDGSSGYSGILGTAFSVGGFVAMCYGIKKLVEALQDIASIGNTDLIDKASEVIKSLITTVGVTEGLLTLFSGFNIGAVAGPVAVGFSGTLGAIVGIGAFVAACYGIKKLVDALVMLADSGNILKIAMAESIMEKLIVIVRHTTELLGAMAGVNLGAIVPGFGVGFLGSLGVPLGAWSFVQACNGIKVMAEAMTELSGISDSDLSEAKFNSLEKLVNIAKSVFSLKIGDFFLSGSGIKKTKAQAFAEVVQPIKELMGAVSSISGEDYDPEAAQNVIFRLQEVATIATDIFNADWFSSDKTIDNIGAKASAFGEVVEPIQDLLYAISSISGEGYDIESAGSVLKNLKTVVDMASSVFKADWFNSDDRAVAIATKAGAFSEVSEGIISLMSTITDLYSMELPGIDAASGADLGAGISAFIDAIVSAYTGSLSANSQTVYDAAIDLTDNVQSPIISAANDAYDWGADLVMLFAAGINSAVGYATAAAAYVAASVHSILGFSEPEKGPLSDFHTYAPDMIKLWNKGIYDNIGSVRESSYSVADSVYDGFSTALDYVSDLIDNGMSDQLTIRPIMDLSEIQNGMNSMSGMLSSADGYQITGTTKLAASAAYGIGVKSEVQQTTQPELVEAGAINNTFYITNNDPNAVAEKVSKIISGQVRRQKAVWAR